MTDTIFDIIRHGEPVGGRAYRGNSIDDPLSETGWLQMRSAVADRGNWHRVVSSPMRRCREFAEEVADKQEIPLEIEPEIREVGFGCWEGRTPDEIRSANLSEYNAFYADPVNNRPAGAEELADFYERSVKSVNDRIDRCEGQRILVVTHAGVMRAIMTWAMQAPLASMYRFKPAYASLFQVRTRDQQVYLNL